MSVADDLQSKAKRLHDDMVSALGASPKADKMTVVTIASLHDGDSGQWIVGDEKQDRATVARRLRICADLLER